MTKLTTAQGAALISDYYAIGRTDLYGEPTYASAAAQELANDQTCRAVKRYLTQLETAPTEAAVAQMVALLSYANAKEGAEHEEMLIEAGDAFLRLQQNFADNDKVQRQIEAASVDFVKSPKSQNVLKEIAALGLSRTNAKSFTDHLGYVLYAQNGSALTTLGYYQLAVENNIDFKAVGQTLSQRFPEQSLAMRHGLEKAVAEKRKFRNGVPVQDALEAFQKGQIDGTAARRAQQRLRPNLAR